jgi:choice-of-anchor B domain-containing protein
MYDGAGSKGGERSLQERIVKLLGLPLKSRSWQVLLFSSAAILLAFAVAADHPSGKEAVPDESPPSPDVIGDIGCTDGFAGDFPCRNVELLAWLTRSALGLGQINDLWGWTDPLTGTEYAILGAHSAIAFVDLSNPMQPVHVGTLPTQTSPSLWNDMKVLGDYAFIVSEARNHGMQVFDLTLLSSVTSPPEVFAPAAVYSGFGNSHNVAINEEAAYAYAAGTNSCRGGLHIVDIADPLQPTFAGCFRDDGYTHDAQCVRYHGPDLDHNGGDICFASNEDTLTIADVTDPAAAVQLSRSGYLGQRYTHQGWLTDDHQYFFVDDEFDERTFGIRSRTYVWDVSDLDAPVLMGAHSGTTGSIDHNQYVVGDHLFQANYTSGLRILRMGNLDAAELLEIGFFDTYPHDNQTHFEGAWSVYPFFKSGILIVSDMNRGLFVLQPNLAGIPRCDDGFDNDHDGLFDYPEDPSCDGPEDNTESPRNDVVVDIKPGTALNMINPRRRGVIRVAVLGQDDFNVEKVDVNTLRFGPDEARPKHRRRKANKARFLDLNDDGHLDLVTRFRTRETGIERGDTEACLAFEMLDLTPYEGCDSVRTTPGCGSGFELAFALPVFATWRRYRRHSCRPGTCIAG